MYSLAELAGLLSLPFSGDPQRELRALASLESAGPGDLTFLAGRRHLPLLGTTRAGAVILHPEHADCCPADHLCSADPYLAFARATRLFDRSPAAPVGIHPAAVVDPHARVHPGAGVGPGAVVEAGAEVAAGAVLGAGVYLGHGSRVGAGTRVYPNACIYHDVIVGRQCVIHAQAVLGADGFGFARGSEGWEKIHQLGGVRIGDRVEIGALSAVDRGTLGHTVIEDGVIVDNLVQIGHNCRIGKNTAIAGCTGIAGSSIIGADCTLAGGVGVLGHLQICDGVHVTAMTMVTRSITEPGSYSSGTPMSATRTWKRNAVRFNQLEAIQRRLAALESRGE